MTTFTDFLLWEQSTRDIIDFKKAYVDMAGDVLAGLVLSEIVYWHLPKRDGESKLRVNKNNHDWIACRRVEWWDRTRMTPRQIDRVFDILVKKGLIVKDRFHFAGKPTVHIRLVQEAFLKAWEAVTANPPANPYSNLPKREIREEKPLINETVNSNSPNGESQLTDNVNSYTETTTSVTTPIKESSASAFNEMKDAIRKAFGWDMPTTNEWGQIQKAAKQLLAVNITPADIPSLYKYCVAKSKGESFTPLYLSNKKSEWQKNRPPRVIPDNPIIPLDPSLDDGTPATPEQIEQAKQLWADLLKKTKAV